MFSQSEDVCVTWQDIGGGEGDKTWHMFWVMSWFLSVWNLHRLAISPGMLFGRTTTSYEVWRARFSSRSGVDTQWVPGFLRRRPGVNRPMCFSAWQKLSDRARPTEHVTNESGNSWMGVDILGLWAWIEVNRQGRRVAVGIRVQSGRRFISLLTPLCEKPALGVEFWRPEASSLDPRSSATVPAGRCVADDSRG